MQWQMSNTKILTLNQVKIKDSFWSYYMDLVKDVVVPYQWQALNDQIPDAEPSHAIKNLKIAAGVEKGEFYGMVFQDSDIAKWLEAVGYLLLIERDSELERIADGVIDLLDQAQAENGYLNTYYLLKEPGKQWTNLCECHELYCAGHLIEGAIAYFQATGKRNILDVVTKLADHIDDTFGYEPEKLQGYDGHQEIELALLKLYEVTEDEKYLKLAQYFLEIRGVQQEPHFYEIELAKRDGKTHGWDWMHQNKAYSQAHQTIHEQKDAIGHAVRAVYMYTGMAHLAALTQDEKMHHTCKRLWKSIVSKQMYLTGAIGSQAHGEAFSFDYDLPNDTVYAETCASIGLIFFGQRMLQIEPHREYADVMERALYNTVLGGMSRDGKNFFYVNPLEVHPLACEKNENYLHVKSTRQKWFGCACCPPNLARLIASLGQYLYTVKENIIYANMYMSGEATVTIKGAQVILKQNSNYPWEETIDLKVQIDKETEFAIALRIPSWSHGFSIKINDEVYTAAEKSENGYVMIERSWKNSDQITLNLSLPVLVMRSHPFVRQNVEKIALQRGPIVYCLEAADNGENLHQLELMIEKGFEIAKDSTFIEDLFILQGWAKKVKNQEWKDELYLPYEAVESEIVPVKLIPYFSWANREIGEMQVWTRFVK